MQTVYLLKNCSKSYIALKKLYNYPDLSTNIIIVDKDHARILYLDKRVKKFPFIINTLPTSIGLIPKIAKVLPLNMFMMLKNFNSKLNQRVNANVNVNVNKNKSKTVTIPVKSLQVKKNYYQPRRQFYSRIPSTLTRHPKKNPIVRTFKENDGSVNIILNK